MIGPGAIASPVFSADQPQTSCSQSTTDSSIAPKDTEKSSAISDAPEKLRTLSRAGSISGLWCRAQCAAKSPSAAADPASTATVAADDQPQLPPLTRPRESAPTPAVTSSAPSASGRGPG